MTMPGNIIGWDVALAEDSADEFYYQRIYDLLKDEIWNHEFKYISDVDSNKTYHLHIYMTEEASVILALTFRMSIGRLRYEDRLIGRDEYYRNLSRHRK